MIINMLSPDEDAYRIGHEHIINLVPKISGVPRSGHTYFIKGKNTLRKFMRSIRQGGYQMGRRAGNVAFPGAEELCRERNDSNERTKEEGWREIIEET